MVILLVAFRSIVFAAIGLVPLVVGILFMVAGMCYAASVSTPPTLSSCRWFWGCRDSGIYIINRFRREDGSARRRHEQHRNRGSPETLTIMASFGALMVAHHQGVFSIGAVMSLGMVACQVAFIVVLPAVLNAGGEVGSDKSPAAALPLVGRDIRRNTSGTPRVPGPRAPGSWSYFSKHEEGF